VFPSWPDTRGPPDLGGEPAMTLSASCWPPESWRSAAALTVGV
jgi:hypothetical protein